MHYKSLDDVSYNEQRAQSAGKVQPSKCSAAFDSFNHRQNARNRKPVRLESLQCDKTPKRSKNAPGSKRCLHHSCERSNHLSANGIASDNKSPILGGRAQSHEETFSPRNGRPAKQNLCKKSTNMGERWLSTQSLQGSSSGDVTAASLRRRIVCSLVLLEAFGNAFDRTNSNSSRFVSPLVRTPTYTLLKFVHSFQGCFYDIELDFKGDPISAHINCCKRIRISITYILSDSISRFSFADMLEKVSDIND